VHRYRRVSGPLERQQTKGVLSAFALWSALVVLLVATPLSTSSRQPTGRGLLAHLAVELATTVTLTLVPVAIALAVLRYRLFEVDVWISRALVYGLLTSFVVGTYVVVVGGLGALWRDGGTVLRSSRRAWSPSPSARCGSGCSARCTNWCTGAG
jgi:hypothetical protein